MIPSNSQNEMLRDVYTTMKHESFLRKCNKTSQTQHVPNCNLMSSIPNLKPVLPPAFFISIVGKTILPACQAENLGAVLESSLSHPHRFCQESSLALPEIISRVGTVLITSTTPTLVWVTIISHLDQSNGLLTGMFLLLSSLTIWSQSFSHIMSLLCWEPTSSSPFHSEQKPKSLQWLTSPYLIWSFGSYVLLLSLLFTQLIHTGFLAIPQKTSGTPLL